MTEHRDPLSFDFGLGFQSFKERLVGERAERKEIGARALPFYHAFLDDYLRCILPNDLILIGAETGAGKTELARHIAASNARAGKRVFYFALEAEHREIERRTKYAEIAQAVIRGGVRVPGGINYIDWYRGSLEPYLHEIDVEVDEILAEKYATLHTYYRGSKFGHEQLTRILLAIQDQADLIVVDHLHYIDIDDDNENRGFKTLVKAMRDVAIAIGRPILLVAHLRKSDRTRKRIVPDKEDFHGSSDIIKIATDCVLLAPALCQPSRRHGVANTFFSIPKAREAGATRYVALSEFDYRTKQYAATYTLGRETKPGDWEALGTDEVPGWARNHEPLSVPFDAANAALRNA
jgi:replicative DNA helicase